TDAFGRTRRSTSPLECLAECADNYPVNRWSTIGRTRTRVAGAARLPGRLLRNNWACLALFVENRECTRGLEVGPSTVVVSRGHLNRECVAGERLVQDQRDSQRDRLACRTAANCCW